MTVIVQRLWFGLGMMFLGCGAAGIVLPLVPTTPFLLLAAYAFARSSPSMHDWLLTHPRFGRVIDDWRREGGIEPRVKLTAVLALGATFAPTWFLDFPGWVLAVHATALAAVAAFILTRPHPTRHG